MFCIAEFAGTGDKKEIAIVHKSWVYGNKCFWPPFWRNGQQLNNAIKNGMAPDLSTWFTYEIRIIGNRCFETYETARKNLGSAEVGSDFSADEHNKRKRSKLRTRPTESKYDDESDSDLNVAIDDCRTPVAPKKRQKAKPRSLGFDLPTPPTPPSKPASIPLSSGPSLVAVSHEFENSMQTVPSATVTANNGIFDGNDTSASLCQFSIPHETVVAAHNNVDYFHGGNHSQYEVSNSVPCFSTESTKLLEAIKCVQTSQEILTAKVDIALDILRTFIKGNHAKESFQSTGTLNMPFTSMDDFCRVDEQRKTDSKLRSELILTLSTKGGNTANQIVHRVMSALMTNELMLSFTFAGHTGKKSFRDTVFMSCICDAVRRQPKGSVATDKEIESATEYWLKKASVRIAKRSRVDASNDFDDDQE